MILLKLFWAYFKIGLFTIGGGYAMLPLVRQELVGTYVTEELFLDLLAIAEATPGPFAINMATYIGAEVGVNTYGSVFMGLLGGAIATFAVMLPSLIIVTVVTSLLTKYKSNKIIQGAMYGIRPVVVGLVFSALLMIVLAVVWPSVDTTDLTNSIFGAFDWISLLLVAFFLGISFIRIKGKKIDSIALIIFSAVVGIVVFGAIGL